MIVRSDLGDMVARDPNSFPMKDGIDGQARKIVLEVLKGLSSIRSVIQKDRHDHVVGPPRIAVTQTESVLYELVVENEKAIVVVVVKMLSLIDVLREHYTQFHFIFGDKVERSVDE